MGEDNSTTKKPVSIVDSALIIGMVSGIAYVLGYVARIGMAERLGVPLFLLPTVGAETTLLIGGLYLVLNGAIGLLLYFLWLLAGRKIFSGWAWAQHQWAAIAARVTEHPRVYALLALLSVSTALYTSSRLLPINPRLLGTRQLSDVLLLKLKEGDTSMAGRSLQYLWKESELFVLKDKRTAELVLVNKDHIDLIVLSTPR